MLTVTVTGGCVDVAAVTARISTYLERQQVAPRSILRAELLIEEVVLNAMRHGGAPQVEITASAAPSAPIRLVFEDRGAPFDPVTAPLPQPAAGTDLAGSSIGGRGLMLLRRLSQHLAYERTPDGRNSLRITLG